MNMETLLSWLSTTVAMVAAGVAIWQAREAKKQAEAAQRQAAAAEESNRLAKQSLMEHYIDEAVRHWEDKGQPDTFISTLTNLSDIEREQIRKAARTRHKGQ